MSHFSTILKNLVGSGMTNTKAALTVLEAFFEKNDQDSCDMAVQYLGNIADTNDKVANGTISEQDAQMAFAKVRQSTLNLINTVDELEFDDAVVVSYFAMLTPNPAKDPFFSPIAPEEQAATVVEKDTPSVAESPKSDTDSAGSSWLWIIGGIGLFLVIGLIYLIVAFGECTTAPQSSAFATTPQPVAPTKPTDVNKAATTPTTQSATATSGSTASTTKTPITPTTKPLPEKPKAPEIKVRPAREREKVKSITDSLMTVNNTLKLKVAELEKVQLEWAKLIESAKKDPSQAAQRDEEKQKFMVLSDDIKILRSEIKRLAAALPK